MIDALFSQTNYVAAKKLLDATTLRHEALSSNIANIETPGYKRLDVNASFKSELGKAMAGQSAPAIRKLQPQLAVDNTAVAKGLDGNTVNMEEELLKMNENTVAHTVETQLISSNLIKLRMAITGKS